MPTTIQLIQAMDAALAEAGKFVGSTAPNPPVGAVALNSQGQILHAFAHQKAGQPHAEAGLIEGCRSLGILDQVHTLVVTLEPCNHKGKTPPCTLAILESGIQNVVYGCPDPNPAVTGQGAGKLVTGGIQVTAIGTVNFETEKRCRSLITPWAYRVLNKMPYVTVKQALNEEGSMIPHQGQKTFTSEASLVFAHELRKRSDAILTGVGTVLSDRPLFTVRKVADHGIIPSQKKRILVVMDRLGRCPADWTKDAKALGFDVWIRQNLAETLQELAQVGANEVLVEAGPGLTSAVLQGSFCQRHVVIQAQSKGRPDEIKDHVYWNY